MNSPVGSANLFSNLPSAVDAEVVTELLARPGIRIERIVSSGQSSPEGFFYDQVEAEWVLLLQGQAELDVEIEGEWQRISLQAGSYFDLSAHQKHRVQSTSEEPVCVWLAVFYSQV